MNYRDYNDYELISFIRESHEEANEIIFEKYKPLIESNARKMGKYCNKNGLEFYDLVQEGMVGLNQAIISFNEQKDTTFYTYAKTCIERKIISAIIGSERQKHKLLNESISYDNTELESGKEMPKILMDYTSNPEALIIEQLEAETLLEKIRKILTPFEKEVFDLKIDGFTYIEISEKLDKDKKQIDNAIQRIKNKIKDNLDN